MWIVKNILEPQCSLMLKKQNKGVNGLTKFVKFKIRVVYNEVLYTQLS